MPLCCCHRWRGVHTEVRLLPCLIMFPPEPLPEKHGICDIIKASCRGNMTSKPLVTESGLISYTRKQLLPQCGLSVMHSMTLIHPRWRSPCQAVLIVQAWLRLPRDGLFCGCQRDGRVWAAAALCVPLSSRGVKKDVGMSVLIRYQGTES